MCGGNFGWLVNSMSARLQAEETRHILMVEEVDCGGGTSTGGGQDFLQSR